MKTITEFLYEEKARLNLEKSILHWFKNKMTLSGELTRGISGKHLEFIPDTPLKNAQFKFFKKFVIGDKTASVYTNGISMSDTYWKKLLDEYKIY